MAGPFGIVRYGRDEMAQYEHQMDSASADIAPGDLIERVDDGGDIKVQPNGTTVDTEATVYIAVAARDRGMNAVTGDQVDSEPDVYSTSGDDYVRYVKLSGGGVHGRLAAGTDLAASAEATITVGDKLVSAGGADAGKLKLYDSTNDDGDAVILEAEEAVDNSGAATGDDAFIEVTTA